MIYLQFETGGWYAGAVSEDPNGDWAAAVQTEHGPLQAVESETDPRTGTLTQDVHAPRPRNREETFKTEMLAATTPDEGFAALKKWAAAR